MPEVHTKRTRVSGVYWARRGLEDKVRETGGQSKTESQQTVPG